jgi:hypothetical protein
MDFPSDVLKRFWAKVLKQPGDGCWEWIGAKHTGGYGQLRVSGVLKTTHRLSWEIHKGEVPAGLWVLHKCDNRACVRPEHLFVGTGLQNVRDTVAKGRHRGRTSKDIIAKDNIVQKRIRYLEQALRSQVQFWNLLLNLPSEDPKSFAEATARKAVEHAMQVLKKQAIMKA